MHVCVYACVCVCVCVYMRCESVSCSVVSNSVRPHELWPTRLLCPWNSPGKDAEVNNHFLHQGIFLTQGYVCMCVFIYARVAIETENTTAQSGCLHNRNLFSHSSGS